jgi:hypothetical protein
MDAVKDSFLNYFLFGLRQELFIHFLDP